MKGDTVIIWSHEKYRGGYHNYEFVDNRKIAVLWALK